VEQNTSTEKKREIRQQAENLLQKVRSEIEAGKTFADLAKTHSEGPSAPSGGSLGSFGRGKMVPEFDRACFEQLSVGEISDLVETEFGFHIIKLEDKKIETRTFDEVKQEIKTLLVKTDAANTARELADQLLMDVELDNYEIAMQQEDYTSKGLVVKETGLFEKDASSIPNIGSRYTYGDLIEKAFEMELNINDVIEVKRSNGEVEGFFVAIVLEKKTAAIPAFEDVKPAVKSDLKEEKAKQLALEDAGKVMSARQGDRSLEEVLKGYTSPEGTSIKDKKIEESGLFTLSVNSTYISNMGACQDAMFKAFQMELNEVAGPFEGDVAHYIIQLIEREEADMEKLTSESKVKAKVMKTLLQSKKNEEFTNWYNSMRKRITITDHRSQL
jgi:peptidyl-prolyl cis-trans isomerase D